MNPYAERPRNTVATPRDGEMAVRSRRTVSRASVAVPVSMALAERRHIMRAVAFTNGQIEGDGGAAALLGLKPSTLRTRIAKLGIRR